jgi:molybdenum cofactor cytidylyltransferase
MPDPGSVAAIVLAAGSGSRFGGPAGSKLLALIAGRPILQHVLDRAAEAGIERQILVVPPGDAGVALETAIEWGTARRIPNPAPERGLASSLQLGWAAASALRPAPEATLVLLGDQPAVPPRVIDALLAAPLDPTRPVVAPRYASGGGPNPLRLEPEAAPLILEASGDRGLGPLLGTRPALVRWLDAGGGNPDVDEPADIEVLAAALAVEPDDRP